jgi:hypothetical protein
MTSHILLKSSGHSSLNTLSLCYGEHLLVFVEKNNVLYTQPLKMELTEGSETSANHNLTPGKYPKEYIQKECRLF